MVDGATTVRKKSQLDFKQSILISFQPSHDRKESHEHSVNSDPRSRIRRKYKDFPISSLSAKQPTSMLQLQVGRSIRRDIYTEDNAEQEMALTLALPLFGLDPEHFSTLSMKLLNIEREQNLRNLSDSGRTSPSTGSESSGISSLATSAESASVELTPISSRPETPTKGASCKSQEKTTVRVVYEGRDILNLGANIRSSFNWQMRDRTLSRHNFQDFITNRLVYHRLREQSFIYKDHVTKCCNECEFCEPSFIF